MSLGILEWEDENSLSNYPLFSSKLDKDVIVDAKFIQFDGFVPTLRSVTVYTDKIKISITFDKETVELEYTQASFIAEEQYAVFRSTSTQRFLGVVMFGPGVVNLMASFAGKTFTLNEKFVASTVVPVDSTTGVFTLDGHFGFVGIWAAEGDDTFFRNYDETHMMFHAVDNHAIPAVPVVALKRLNLQVPVHNNVYIAGNDVIKLAPTVSNTGLKVSVVSTTNTTKTVPTLIS